MNSFHCRESPDAGRARGKGTGSSGQGRATVFGKMRGNFVFGLEVVVGGVDLTDQSWGIWNYCSVRKAWSGSHDPVSGKYFTDENGKFS